MEMFEYVAVLTSIIIGLGIAPAFHGGISVPAANSMRASDR